MYAHTMLMYQELSHCHGNLGAKPEIVLHDWSPQVQVPLSHSQLSVACGMESWAKTWLPKTKMS